MVRVVMDARHHVGTAESLRIFERGVGDQFAGFEIDQAQDDRGRAQVHGDAVNRPAAIGDLLSIEQDAVSHRA